MTAHIHEVADQTFDYVIVGGGSAGLCVAARLSEDPIVSVLVLEAGDTNFNDPAIMMPASYGSHFGKKEYDWAFSTTPQVHSNGRQFFWPRGKGLGGSSSINFMVWNKPPSEEIDDFEKLGNPGWNWARYQLYLNQLEGYTPPSQKSAALHGLNFDDWTIGKDGPMKLYHPATITSVELAASQAMMRLGIPHAPEPMSGNPKGTYFAPKTIDPRTYTRSYAVTAFYLPNASRPNLTVLVRAHVHRLHTDVDSSSGELVATSVEFSYDGETYLVNAAKEVILSAGTLKSPQILELSGIGRRDVLEPLGIPVKLELLGVGENSQEHMYVGVTYELGDHVQDYTFDDLRDPEGRIKHLELYKDVDGAFTVGVTGLVVAPLQMLSEHAGEIYNALREKIKRNWDSYSPGLQAQYEIQLGRLDTASPCEIILTPGSMSAPNPPLPGKKYFNFGCCLNHTFSRGTVHITSSNPDKDPALDPHYFEQEIDYQHLAELIKFSRKVMTDPTFAALFTSPIKELNPGPEVVTDDQLIDHLKEWSKTTFHTIGTCSMLPKDKGGVVDNRLKVYGTANIRVVDLSIAPLHFAAHSLTTTYAIAEQAADIIKGKI